MELTGFEPSRTAEGVIPARIRTVAQAPLRALAGRLPLVKEHLAKHTGPAKDALLFPAAQGGPCTREPSGSASPRPGTPPDGLGTWACYRGDALSTVSSASLAQPMMPPDTHGVWHRGQYRKF